MEPDSSRPGALLQALTGLLADEADDSTASLGAALARLVPALGADRGFVFVPGEGGALTPAAAHLGPRGLPAAEDPPSRSLVAKVAAGRVPVLSTTLETEELRTLHASIPGVLASILAVPLDLPGGAGVLYLDSALERRRFEEADRDLLVAFGRAAGDRVRRAGERRAEKARADRLAEILRRTGQGELLGGSPAMAQVMGELARAAATDVTVLVGGESGTGKELAARCLHRAGARRDGPFVALNCAAIPPELVESELFGHEKGAFSGATERRLGHFELAEGGTLFLDEVGELPPAAQAKLLRALQEKSIQRLGGGKPHSIDFRLVAATHVPLEAAVEAGSFREDLFYRLAVFRILMPPLRARGGDVLLLARTFLERFAREMGRPVKGFEPEAEAALARHGWPGNVRELANVIEQAVVREDGERIRLASVAPALAGPGPREAGATPDLDTAKKDFERRFLAYHLRKSGGNMKATAQALGLSRRNIYLKCDELGIDYSGLREE